MSGNPQTPQKQKRKTNDGACFSPPAKKWETPTKGKTTDITGFVMMVGQEQTSNNNNIYFDVVIQLAAKERRKVRVMKTESVGREVFLTGFEKGVATQCVQLKSVFLTQSTYFYNTSNGSAHIFSDKSPGFQPAPYSVFTSKSVENDVSAEVDIHAQVVYLNSVRFNPKNGSPYRNVVFQTDQNEMIYGTIWSEDLFNLQQNTPLYITNLKKKDFFGMLLYTTTNTMVMASGVNSKPALTAHQLQPFKLRAVNVHNPVHQKVAGIMGCSFKMLAPCPDRNCSGQLLPAAPGGKIGSCNAELCNKRVNLSLVKPSLKGEINLEDDLTLIVDKDAVDSTFGVGVYQLYINKPIELADKFLELMDVTVIYDKKTKRCVMVDQE